MKRTKRNKMFMAMAKARRLFETLIPLMNDLSKEHLEYAQRALDELFHACARAEQGADKTEILERLWTELINPEE